MESEHSGIPADIRIRHLLNTSEDLPLVQTCALIQHESLPNHEKKGTTFFLNMVANQVSRLPEKGGSIPSSATLCSPLRFVCKIHFFLYYFLSYSEETFDLKEVNSYDLQSTFTLTLLAEVRHFFYAKRG
jgi:hypothetical protein